MRFKEFISEDKKLRRLLKLLRQEVKFIKKNKLLIDYKFRLNYHRVSKIELQRKRRENVKRFLMRRPKE